MKNQQPLIPSRKSFTDNVFGPIRLILALSVIYSHSYPIGGWRKGLDPLEEFIGGVSVGTLAVNLFLIISGFVVSGSLESSPTVRAFIIKRFLRMYPAYLILMLGQAFLLAPFVCSEKFVGYSLRQLGILAFDSINLVDYGYPYGGLLAIFPYNPMPGVMNGSLWTIRFEFLCYLVLIVLTLTIKRLEWLIPIHIACVWAYFLGWSPPWNKALTLIFGNGDQWPRFLSFFLVGALMYRLRKHLRRDSRIAAIAAASILISVSFWPLGLRLIFPFAAGYLILWIAYHPFLIKLPRPRIGDYSYGVYLYAFPIQQSLVYFLEDLMSSPIILAISASILSLIAGGLSWHLIERPVLSIKRSVA